MGATLVRPHIRWMIRRDMPEVLDIEGKSFECPWDEEDFLRNLRQRNYIGMVMELGERVVAFMIYELCKTKLHLVNIAVHPDYRRQNLGQMMIQKLAGKLSSHRRTAITLEVKEDNLSAQLFYRDQGFKAVKIMRSFYGPGVDAYLMKYTLGNQPVEAEPEEEESRQERYLDKESGGDDDFCCQIP